MTVNQIAYWDLEEKKRSNLATEEETKRHNTVTETETQRHNVASEDETRRHNVETETETNRHNVVWELETERHNRASEVTEARKASAAESQAAAAHRQAANAEALTVLRQQEFEHQKSVDERNISIAADNASANLLRAETEADRNLWQANIANRETLLNESMAPFKKIESVASSVQKASSAFQSVVKAGTDVAGVVAQALPLLMG